MNIAIFGQELTYTQYLNQLLSLLKRRDKKIYMYEPFYEQVKATASFDMTMIDGSFSDIEDLPDSISYFFSIGGDGTFMKSILMLKKKTVPVVGINFGRLGFLSAILREDMEKAIDQILNNECEVEERTLLQLDSKEDLFKDFNFALNEITVAKRDSSSMINIHTYINGEYLTTYWADGLIISTPTGSTAYSLSVGGPILTPDSEAFIITPIAPHNLTMRPIVIPDHYQISLRVEGRGKQFLTSLDSRAQPVNFPGELEIRKAGFKVNTVKLNSNSFFNSLRNRLMWGADKRNI